MVRIQIIDDDFWCAEAIKARFRSNGWSNNWDYPGVYEYAHFHSTTHECLGCANGWMEFNLSVGEGGWTRLRRC